MPSKNRGERNVAAATASKDKESPCRGEHPRKHIVLPLPPSRSCHFYAGTATRLRRTNSAKAIEEERLRLEEEKAEEGATYQTHLCLIPSHLPPPPPLPLPDRVRSTKTQGHGSPPPPTRPYPTCNQIKRTQSSSCVTW